MSGTSFATKAGFVLDAARPVTVLAATAAEAGQAIQGLQAVALLDLAGFVLGGGDERTEAVELDELVRLLEDGAELIDVREKDERDTGYIPGSRNVPYRLLTMCCPDLDSERTVVTICESGARAAIAASILGARGYDARPVVEGGMEAWRARGGDIVSFRRCGSGP